MDRPTKIIVEKLEDRVILNCIDEMTGNASGIDLPINGYKALEMHFITGAEEISSDEITTLHKQNVNVRFPSKEQVIEEGERQVSVWLDGNTERELQHFRVGFRRSFEYVLRRLNAR